MYKKDIKKFTDSSKAVILNTINIFSLKNVTIKLNEESIF